MMATHNNFKKDIPRIVYLGLGDYDKALMFFQTLEKYRPFRPRHIHKDLTLLKRNQSGDKQQGRQLLQQVLKNTEGQRKSLAAAW